MNENIGLISSILGIIAAVLGTIKYVFKPYIKGKTELKEIKEFVNLEFNSWKGFGSIYRGEAFIVGDKFLPIEKYRNKFKNIPKDKLFYLFQCSLESGMKGNWGKWLNMMPYSKELLLVLTSYLKAECNIRPTWRAAYILEKFIKRMPLLEHTVIMVDSEIIDAILGEGVKKYLQNLLQITKDEILKPKIKFVLQELEYFENDLDEYLNFIQDKELE